MGSRAQVAGALTVEGYDPAKIMGDADRFPNSWQYTPDRHRCVVKHMACRGIADGTFEVRDCAESEERIKALAREQRRRPRPVLLSGCTCGGIGDTGAHRPGCIWADR